MVKGPFRKKYESFPYQNDRHKFEAWKEGRTGFALVDAGMKQLYSTGFMHNRVRMLVANFLCKLLLIDYRWGEQVFASELMDFDLSANNGNWQWAAGTGCDAAPYFRIFSPDSQQKKFDADFEYVKKYAPEYISGKAPSPIIDYKKARENSLSLSKAWLNSV